MLFLFSGSCASSRRKLRKTSGATVRPAFAAWPTIALWARRPRGVRSPFLDSRACRCSPKPSSTESNPTSSFFRTLITELGVASTTVQGICCPSSLNTWVMPSFLPIMPIIVPLLDFDFDVDAGRQIELGQRVHSGSARIKDVDQAFVRLELELLARLLVDVRRAENGPALRLCRQRNGTTDLRARLLGGADDVR